MEADYDFHSEGSFLWEDKMGYELKVLQNGYSISKDDCQRANGTITLLEDKSDDQYHVIVDTGSPWDRDVLTSGLSASDLCPADIRLVVCTHGHVDHVGNLNLFASNTRTTQILVGFDACVKDLYDESVGASLRRGEPWDLPGGRVRVLPTPGHCAEHVSVLVKDVLNHGTVLVAGDLFEKAEDVEDESVWTSSSADPARQRVSRRDAAAQCDVVVPGHGKPFLLTQHMRDTLGAAVTPGPS